MSHPTCCCSVSLDRCDRCDLLVDLEGFHLIAVARRECGLVLDIESCEHFAGCPGCGVIAQGHGRVVVEVICGSSELSVGDRVLVGGCG